MGTFLSKELQGSIGELGTEGDLTGTFPAERQERHGTEAGGPVPILLSVAEALCRAQSQSLSLLCTRPIAAPPGRTRALTALRSFRSCLHAGVSILHRYLLDPNIVSFLP